MVLDCTGKVAGSGASVAIKAPLFILSGAIPAVIDSELTPFVIDVRE